MVTVRPGMHVIDLGCGSGELTARLADSLPDSETLGIDSSPEMLARALPRTRSGLQFELQAIESVQGEWDLVFSHAALHWVEDHEALVPRLLSLVSPDGQLAVQIPSNHRHFSQTVIPELASEEPFQSALGGWIRHPPVLPVDRYAELLHEVGAREVTVIEKVYGHVLPDADAIAEWLAGTTLVPYLSRLPDPLREPFLGRYRERLRNRWPSGPIFFPFRRILFVARRPCSWSLVPAL
jgi:trans-aconitate 2-methyltransferase